MTAMKDLRTRITEKLPLIVLILFIIQPLMDVLSYWTAVWNISNIFTSVLRMLVLAAMVLFAFLLSRRKKMYFIAAAICVFIALGHMAASWSYGYQDVVGDLSNYIRVLQLPLTVLSLITFMGENEDCYESMKKGIAINLSIILVVQVLAVVTGTEPHTYDDGAGLIGWFANTNTQSAIVCMVGPVAVSWLYQKKGLKNPWLWICLVGSSVSMFHLGTRLAYAGIVAMCFGLGCSAVIIRLKDWKKAVVLMLVGVVFIALLPLAPMTGHRSGHSNEMGDKQGWFDVSLEDPDKAADLPPEVSDALEELDTPPTATETPEEPVDRPLLYDKDLVANLTEEQKERIKELAPNYSHYVSDLVKVFGIERTVVLFDFTTDITVLTNLRTKKLMVAAALMEDSPFISRLFGVELARFTIEGNIYDVENDFHGIYYLYGAVGLAALLLFLCYFLFLIVKYLIKDFRRYFTLDAAGWGIALVMCLAHSYFTAGVLRRPSAAFYLGAILAAVFYLLKIKKYPDEVVL